MVKAVYYRYYVEGEEEYKSLEEAMLAALHALNYNTAYFESITDGDKVYDHDAIEEYWEAKGWH